MQERGCDEITFTFDGTRTNLLPSNSLNCADGGVASAGSKSVSSLTVYPFLTGLLEGTVIESSDITVSRLPKTKWECPERGNTV